MIDARAYVTNPQGRYKVPWSDVIGIAVHHSVSGLQFFTAAEMTPEDELNHIRMIDTYHASQGWGGFGYHLAAFPSGRLYLCGDLDGARAHVASRNNVLKGIVFIGDFTARDPGPAQLQAGAEAVALVRVAAGAPLPIAGHRTWALPAYPTSCPGDRLAARLNELESTPEEDPEMVMVIDEDTRGVYLMWGAGKRYIDDLQELIAYDRVITADIIELPSAELAAVRNA
jgi:hypothetical protein